MFPELVLAAIMAFANHEKQRHRPAGIQLELLTGKEWTLTSYGFDDNQNGVVDAGEERISDCERDNGYVFSKDGTGYFLDNLVPCGDGVTDYQFKWKLAKNGKRLVFLPGAGNITRLTAEELVMSEQSAQGTFITVFQH